MLSHKLKKPRPERNLIVKKLTEEDEYKPVSKKSPLENREIMQLVKTSTNFSSKPSSVTLDESQFRHQQQIPNNSREVRVPVEIIGVGTTSGFQSVVSSDPQRGDRASASSSRTANPEFTLESTLAAYSSGSKVKAVLKPGENLTEKNYLQIIDNLTSRYGGASSSDLAISQNSPKTVNASTSNSLSGEPLHQQKEVNRKLKKVKNTTTQSDSSYNKHLSISLDLINNLGLNLDLSWSSSRQAAMNRTFNVKEMEKKYRNTYIRETSANNIKKELIYSNLNAQYHPNSHTNSLNLHSNSNSSLAQNNMHSINSNRQSISPRNFYQTHSLESKSRPSSPNNRRAHSTTSSPNHGSTQKNALSSSQRNTPTNKHDKSIAKFMTSYDQSSTVSSNANTTMSTTYLHLTQSISPSLRLLKK